MFRLLSSSCARKQTSLRCLTLPLAACLTITFIAISATAQLADNQTRGFGNNRLVTFTYLQNFDCVDQPQYGSGFQWNHGAIRSKRDANAHLPTSN